ncbi:hypothetical protein FD754_005053 [Muntiacus muntjak]|uniref:HMG box domain-containing protein n=1 Tax=Muntiacus muntjak TaxID=9888 RepID=A0A5N3WIS6_MUNMU|nr:hypothetical protein FD754_005053 [Muntiacus muntjak]
MAKGDPKKSKGKMTAYAFFVQMCREEHKKKNSEVPDNFAEFSKKCSERWKTVSGKQKSKFNEMAKADKAHHRPPSGFFLFCSEFCPKIKSINPGEMWNNLSDREKQPYINKAAELKEKYEKDVADYV